MRRKIRKIRVFLIKLKVKLIDMLNRNKYKKNIAIVSCNKWKNKILEDILLKYYYNKNKIGANIISWEEKIDYSKYDAIIIRSVWGFDFKKFYDWINNIDILVFNDINLINNNFDKNDQYKILDKYNIDHIPTIFLKNNNDLVKNIETEWNKAFKNYSKIVLKPSISESGKNTFVISENTTNKNSIRIDNLNSKTFDKNCTLMIQPFIEEIKYGEYSLIYFNNKISHVIIRNPGIFNNNYDIKYISIDNIDKDLLNIGNQISDLPEYSNSLYMRIDFVKHKEKYLVLEVELIDPILFLNNITDKKKKHNAYKKLVIDTKNKLDI